jgi:hypothetical protein
MASSTIRSSVSASRLWTARALFALTVLFLLFDAFGKLTRPQPVIEAMARLGVPYALWPTIGLTLLAVVIVYAIPKTRVLGVVLLTGYLGGALAIQLRAGTPAFETLFPIIMAVIAWAPVYLLNARVRELIPFSG